MKGDLFRIKQTALEFYKQLLKDNSDCTPTSRVYLQSCIDVLEYEFKRMKESEVKYYVENREVVANLESLGMSRNQSKCMDLIMQNKRVTTNLIYKMLQMPRTESYHLVTTLAEQGLIHIIPSYPRAVVLANKDNPLGPLIENRKNDLLKMESLANSLAPKLINK